MKGSHFLLLFYILTNSEAFLSLRLTHVSECSLHRFKLQNQVPLAGARDKNQEEAIYSNEEACRNPNDQQWRDAVIFSSLPACASGKSTLIEIEVDEYSMKGYTTPGQFIQLRPDDSTTDPIFLAIASPPKKRTSEDASSSRGSYIFQFLIKMSPRLPWLSEALMQGKNVKISPVMGNGFPLNDLQVDKTMKLPLTIFLLAAGSGIAPLKACIESGLLPKSDAKIVLFYGEWTSDDMCFSNLYETWEEEYNVTTNCVQSRSNKQKDYVQDVLSQDEVFTSISTSGVGTMLAIVCGMDDMVASCKEILINNGVSKNHILLNV